MSRTSGRTIPLSPYRRLVDDLMTFSRPVPAVTAERRMSLGPLMDARFASALRPAWSVLFARAYALVARDTPALRQSYMRIPWAHLYEHPHSVATVNVERRVGDEDVVIFCLIRAPENRSLAEIDAIVRHFQTAPVEALRPYQRSVTLSRVPWPFRQWFWWLSLNLIGKQRCRNFGTFSVTSIASRGAGLTTVLPILTSSVHYGLFDGAQLDVRLTFDHRVLDGATAARALTDLESALTREMVRELEEARSAAA
jgi:hypothetical protein